MKSGVILAALAGLLGAAYLIFYVGFDAVFGAVVSVGWGGFALLLLYGAANFVLLGAAWLLLLRVRSVRDFAIYSWGRAVRDSAGDVLPFSQFGGIVIGARAVILRGVSAATAFGSTVVDITVEMTAQIFFILVGLVILVIELPIAHMKFLEATIIGVIVATLVAGAFIVVQRRGFSFFEGIAERFLPRAAVHAAAVNEVINEIHTAPSRLALAFILHFAGWVGTAFGTWLALELIGMPLTFSSVVAIESLLCAMRSAAVIVPGAIGVQEAGYTMMMPLFGLAPDVGLAVSLLKRAREIALAAPVLLSWQAAEGGRAAALREAKRLLEDK